MAGFLTHSFLLQHNLTTKATPITMCQGDLQVSASCGHHHKFHALQQCELYSPTQNRCNGTVTVLYTTTTNCPALCVRCVCRIAANIVKTAEPVTAELEKHIAEISRSVWVERNHPFIYVTLVFERARLREALKGFREETGEELAELRRMQGKGRWDRVADLRDEGCRTFRGPSD